MDLRTIGVVCLLATAACTRAVHEPFLYPVGEAPSNSGNPLKVHLHSGELVLLNSWEETDESLVGMGVRYGLDRMAMGPARAVDLPFDSIALLEMHVRTGSRTTGVAGIAAWTVYFGIYTAVCMADPKSCFGSCPTFYVATDTGSALAAEGFSGSIARALEARDLDALFSARSTGGAFTVTMLNEALETHAVRGLRLVAAPRSTQSRVFASPERSILVAGARMELHRLTPRASPLLSSPPSRSARCRTRR